MKIELTKKFRFEAAHWLPAFPEGHKCRRLHGHSFEVEVVLAGEIDEQTGVLMDFGDLKAIAKPYVDQLDHHCLNHLGEAANDAYLLNPTSENVARWFWFQLKPLLPMLYEVKISETCTSSCTFRG
jgi:6-pyruvoyltetrahydropterin/6-carboxytetrahydropterin synthase